MKYNGLSNKEIYKEKFSVVIPVYNGEKTIKRCIESVLRQTLPPKEILIINDGSSDSTSSIVKSITSNLTNIRLIETKNHGVSAARNTGIEYSTSSNIFFLDSDDYWLPNKIRAHSLHLIEHYNCKASFTNYFLLDELNNNTLILNDRISTHPITATNLALTKSLITGSASSILCSKAAILEAGKFDINLSLGEDLDLWVRMAKNHDICEIKKVEVIITNNFESTQKKLISDKSWAISTSYLYVWDKNKIEINVSNLKLEARRIMRIDMRLHFWQVSKILYFFPRKINSTYPAIFYSLYRNKLLYYWFLFYDTLFDIRSILRKF
jgi:glycosyltransferase involved in cell wall biosynthesis